MSDYESRSPFSSSASGTPGEGPARAARYTRRATLATLERLLARRKEALSSALATGTDATPEGAEPVEVLRSEVDALEQAIRLLGADVRDWQ